MWELSRRSLVGGIIRNSCRLASRSSTLLYRLSLLGGAAPQKERHWNRYGTDLETGVAQHPKKPSPQEMASMNAAESDTDPKTPPCILIIFSAAR